MIDVTARVVPTRRVTLDSKLGVAYGLTTRPTSYPSGQLNVPPYRFHHSRISLLLASDASSRPNSRPVPLWSQSYTSYDWLTRCATVPLLIIGSLFTSVTLSLGTHRSWRHDDNLSDWMPSLTKASRLLFRRESEWAPSRLCSPWCASQITLKIVRDVEPFRHPNSSRVLLFLLQVSG